MTEKIQPIHKIVYPEDLKAVGCEIKALLVRTDVRELLARRGLSERLAPYTGNDTAVAATAIDARRRHSNSGQATFLLRGDSGDILGMATIDPNKTLKQSRTSLNTHISRLVLEKPIVTQGYEVTAWTVPSDEGQILLEAAYAQLSKRSVFADPYFAKRVRQTGKEYPPVAGDLAWTLEPEASPQNVHDAIGQAGFVAYARGYYDDETIRHNRFPPSYLYEKLGA